MQKGLRVSFDGRAGTVVGQMPHGMVDVRFDDAPERTERRHRDRLKALARTNGRPPRRARRARRNNEEDEEGTERKVAARVPASEQEAVAARYRKTSVKQAQLSDVLMERRIAFSVQPDPPRMSKGPRGQRNYCGNPIDGAAYYAYVQTDKTARETAVKWIEVPAIIDRYLKIGKGVSARQELDRLRGKEEDDLTDIPIPEGFEYPDDGRTVLTVKEARKWLAGKLAEEPGTRVSRSFINEYVSSTGDRDLAVDTPFLQMVFLTIVVAPSSRDSQDRTYAVRFGKPGGQLLRVKQKGKRSPAPRLPMGMLKEAARDRQYAPKRVSRQETWLDWQDLIGELDRYAEAVNRDEIPKAQRIAGRQSASPVAPRRAKSTKYKTAGLSDKLASRGRKLPLVTKRLSGKTLAAFNKDIKSLKSWAESSGMRSAWAYEDGETYATISVFSRSDAGARALREFNPYQRFEREINRSQVNDEVAEDFGLGVASVVRAFNTSPVVAQALIESRGIRVRGIGALSPGQDPFAEARDGVIKLRIDLKDKSLSPFFAWQRMRKPIEQVIAGTPAPMAKGREFDYTLRRRAGSRLPYPPCLTPQDEAAIAQIKELENGLRAFTRSLGRIQGLYRRMAEGQRTITERDVIRAAQSLGRALLGFYSAVFRFDRINEREGTSPQVQAAARAVSTLVEDAAESLRLDLGVESVPVAVFERAEFTPETSRAQYGNATVRRVVADLRRKKSPRVEIRSWSSEAEELRRQGVPEKDITPDQKRTGYIEYRALPGGERSNLETEREVRDFLTDFYTTRVEPVATKKKKKKGEPTLSDEIIGRETFKVPSVETKGQSDTLAVPIPRETGSSALLYFAGTPLQLLQAGQGVIRPTWTTKALNSPVGDVLGYLAPSLKRYPRVAGRLFEDMQFNANPGGLVNIPDKAIWLRVLELGQGFNSYSRDAEERLDRAEVFLKTAGEKFKKAEDAVIAFNTKYPKGVIDLGKVRDPQVRRKISLNRKTLERAAAQARRRQEAAQQRYDEALRDASQSERFVVKKPKGWSEEKHQEQMDKNWALAQVIEHIFDENDNASRKRAVQAFVLAELYYRYGGYSIRGPLAPEQGMESRGEEVLSALRAARIDIQGGQPPQSPQYSVFVTYNPVLYHLTQLHWRRGLKAREGSGWSILGEPEAVAALDAVGRFGYVAAETQKVAMESQTPEEAVAGLQRLVYPALATLAVAGLEPIERNQDINGNFNQTRVYAPFMCTWPLGASPQQAINNVADWTGLLLTQDGRKFDVVNTGQAAPIQYVVMLRKGAREGIDVGDVFGIGAGAEDQLLWLNARTRKLPSTYVGALVPGPKQYTETALSRIKKAEKLSEDQVSKKIDLINKTLRLLGEK